MNRPGVGQQVSFPLIPVEDWREDASCAGEHPLWDDGIDAETPQHRRVRHAHAQTICVTKCPVRVQCSAAVDWRFDDGVRGGHVLPSLGARAGANSSVRDLEMLRLLKAGVPLDEAARLVARYKRKAS